MKKTLSLICLLLIAFSCTDSDSVNTESEIIPDRNVYVAGYITDASGNSNSSLLEFTVEAGVQDQQDDTDNNGDTTPINEEKSSLMTSTNIQIGLLIVVLLVIIAFIRVLQNDSKDDDKWS